MDKVIKQILEIDSSAVEIRKQTELIVKFKDRELKEKLKLIDDENLEQAKERGNREYERIVSEGREEAEKIINMAEQKVRMLDEIFSKKFDEMKYTIFKQLFIDNNE